MWREGERESLTWKWFQGELCVCVSEVYST